MCEHEGERVYVWACVSMDKFRQIELHIPYKTITVINCHGGDIFTIVGNSVSTCEYPIVLQRHVIKYIKAISWLNEFLGYLILLNIMYLCTYSV